MYYISPIYLHLLQQYKNHRFGYQHMLSQALVNYVRCALLICQVDPKLMNTCKILTLQLLSHLYRFLQIMKCRKMSLFFRIKGALLNKCFNAQNKCFEVSSQSNEDNNGYKVDCLCFYGNHAINNEVGGFSCNILMLLMTLS